MEEISNYLNEVRRDFARQELDVNAVSTNPFEQFAKWLEEAVQASILDPQAMTLCTVDAEGRPSARVVYMRGFSEEGLVLYTNYNSQKGQDILANPKVCLNFFYPEMERQMRLDGTATKVASEVSDEYFNNRPRKSQLGAWASQQSSAIGSRDALHQAFADAEKQFEGQETVPRPPHWGGFVVSIDSFEFWQVRPGRMHDRLKYRKVSDGSWQIERLNP